jgi:hypothetical protein
MSVIAVQSSNRGRNPILPDTDEYTGLWLNIGVYQSDPDAEEGTKPAFVRLPRGVAVSDLKTRRIYDNMDAEFAASANLMNQLIEEIRKKGLTLGEGESVPVNLTVYLYRRQEETVQAATPAANEELSKALFA